MPTPSLVPLPVKEPLTPGHPRRRGGDRDPKVECRVETGGVEGKSPEREPKDRKTEVGMDAQGTENK